MPSLKEPKKVKDLLAGYGDIPSDGKCTYAFDYSTGKTLLLVESQKKVTRMLLLTSGGLQHQISGIIGGYSRHASSVVSLLCQMCKITEHDLDEWNAWFDQENSANADRSGLQALKDLAEKHGFDIKKRAQPKKKP